MFCNHCGNEILIIDKFCNQCGDRVTSKDKVKKSSKSDQIESEIIEHSTWNCEYCEQEVSSKNELLNHQGSCMRNPNNIVLESKIMCTKCSCKNLAEAKFCKKCGNELTVYNRNYAGFWVRLGAWLIDFTGALFLQILVWVIFESIGYDTSTTSSAFDWFVVISSTVIYFTFFTAIWSTTPGKRIYGLNLIKEDGAKLDWATSFKRSLRQLLSTCLFGFGYRNMSKQGKEQAWHDIESHTFVLKKKGVNYFFPILLSILGLCIYAMIQAL